MRSSTSIHLEYDARAKLTFSGSSRWLSIGESSNDLAFFFPETVSLEDIKAIENAINDALDKANAIHEAKIEAQTKAIMGDFYVPSKKEAA